ncbi:hypothetical protein D9M70_631290 [compost metagenome]
MTNTAPLMFCASAGFGVSRVPWKEIAAFSGAPLRASSRAQQPPKQKPNVASLEASTCASPWPCSCSSAACMRLRNNARSFLRGIIAAPASSALLGRTVCPYRSAINTT